MRFIRLLEFYVHSISLSHLERKRCHRILHAFCIQEKWSCENVGSAYRFIIKSPTQKAESVQRQNDTHKKNTESIDDHRRLVTVRHVWHKSDLSSLARSPTSCVCVLKIYTYRQRFLSSDTFMMTVLLPPRRCKAPAWIFYCLSLHSTPPVPVGGLLAVIAIDMMGSYKCRANINSPSKSQSVRPC